jgi:hypothetical protein
MKKILALGVAAAIAAGSATVATTTTASAQPGPRWNQDQEWKKWPKKQWNNKWDNDWRYHRRGGNIWPFVIGGAIGYGIGRSYDYYYDYPPAAYEYSGEYSEAHVRWCLAHYPNTYNPATNLYNPRRGVTAECISPYYG